MAYNPYLLAKNVVQFGYDRLKLKTKEEFDELGNVFGNLKGVQQAKQLFDGVFTKQGFEDFMEPFNRAKIGAFETKEDFFSKKLPELRGKVAQGVVGLEGRKPESALEHIIAFNENMRADDKAVLEGNDAIIKNLQKQNILDADKFYTTVPKEIASMLPKEQQDIIAASNRYIDYKALDIGSIVGPMGVVGGVRKIAGKGLQRLAGQAIEREALELIERKGLTISNINDFVTIIEKNTGAKLPSVTKQHLFKKIGAARLLSTKEAQVSEVLTAFNDVAAGRVKSVPLDVNFPEYKMESLYRSADDISYTPANSMKPTAKELSEQIVTPAQVEAASGKFLTNLNKSRFTGDEFKTIQDLHVKGNLSLTKNSRTIEEIMSAPIDTTQSQSRFDFSKMSDEQISTIAKEFTIGQDRLLRVVMDAASPIEKRLDATIKLKATIREAGLNLKLQGLNSAESKIYADQFANELANATDPTVIKGLQNMEELLNLSKNKVGFWDKFIESATAMKLTSPFTFARNAIGNTVSRFYRPLEKGIAGNLSAIETKAANAVRKAKIKSLQKAGKAIPEELLKPIEQQRFAIEAVADAYGAVRGTGVGVKNFFQALADEGIAERSVRAAGQRKGSRAIGGKFGKFVRTPFRLLGAADEMMRTIGHQAEASSIAVRQARKEGLHGIAFWKRIDELASFPTMSGAKEFVEEGGKIVQRPTLVGKSTKEIEEKTSESLFQADLGKISKSVQSLIDTLPGGRLIVPFFKTPINLSKYSFQRGFLTSFFSPRNMKDIGVTRIIKTIRNSKHIPKGGKTEAFLKGIDKNQNTRTEGFARIIIGQVVGFFLLNKAMEGYITGAGPTGSDSGAERDALRRSGWQPFSIRTTDSDNVTTYHSYLGFEPVSQQLALVAMMAEQGENWSEDNKAEAALTIALGVARQQLEQPFFLGMNDIVSSIMDPEHEGYRMANVAAGLVVPAGVSFAEKLFDPEFRETSGVWETIKSRVPWLSESVPLRRDAMGDVIGADRPIGDRLSPSFVSRENISIVDAELRKHNVVIPLVPRTMNGVKLTSQERSDLSERRGKVIKAVLVNVINNPVYQKMSDDNKKKQLSNAIKNDIAKAMELDTRIAVVTKDLGYSLSPEERFAGAKDINKLINNSKFKEFNDSQKVQAMNNLLTALKINDKTIEVPEAVVEKPDRFATPTEPKIEVPKSPSVKETSKEVAEDLDGFEEQPRPRETREPNVVQNNVLNKINTTRKENNLQPYKFSGALSDAALKKANDMLQKGYIAHNTPDGLRPWEFIDREAYPYMNAAENIASGFTSITAAYQALLDSKTHFEVIVNNDMQDVGIAIVKNPETNTFLMVQMFGTTIKK